MFPHSTDYSSRVSRMERLVPYDVMTDALTRSKQDSFEDDPKRILRAFRLRKLMGGVAWIQMPILPLVLRDPLWVMINTK
jgi:hypothetical protein